MKFSTSCLTNNLSLLIDISNNSYQATLDHDLFNQDIEELVENACSALWSLSLEDENIEIMNEQKVISMLIESIRDHINAPKVPVYPIPLTVC